MFVVADPEIEAERRRWRAHFSRFALAEEKPDLVIAIDPGGRTRIRGRGVHLDIDDEELIEGVAGRLAKSSRLEAEARGVLSTMPLTPSSEPLPDRRFVSPTRLQCHTTRH
jgi:hypothetical protein